MKRMQTLMCIVLALSLLLGLGLALLSKRDFVGAEEALLNAVRNSPHLAEAYVQLAQEFLKRNNG